MKKMCVIGLGYIGLPTSAVFARAGYKVVGVDINPSIVESINSGKIHIEETGLAEVVAQAVEKGDLRASLVPEKADVFIIAVPTPIYDTHEANMDFVESAVRSINPLLEKGNVVIVESTIPPRTMNDIVVPIIDESKLDPYTDVHIAHCPERVLPGRILIELSENTRVVGGVTAEAAEKAAEVYRTIVTKGEVITTKAVTAEMAKLMENTYRDVNIALANELVKISAKLDVNAHEVIQLANKHPRVNIHQPGPGVGGHCLAVDPYFIIEKAVEDSPLIQTARTINNSMPAFVIEQTKKLLHGIDRPKVAIFGLAYKGNIDDVRESPALEVAEFFMQDDSIQTKVYDPYVKQEQVNFSLTSFDEAISDAHLILVLTDHNEFKQLNSDLLKRQMANPVIFDTKNCVQDDQQLNIYRIGHLQPTASNRSEEEVQ